MKCSISSSVSASRAKRRDVFDVGAREAGHAIESRSRTPLATMPIVATYPFLSDEWFVAVREIVDRAQRSRSRRTPSSP